jgi:hypothetical protein
MATQSENTSVNVTHPSGITVTVELSEQDGAIVVQIDSTDETPSDGQGTPLVRVHLNDCCIANETSLKDGATGW